MSADPLSPDGAGASSEDGGLAARLSVIPFYGTAFFSLSIGGLIGIELPLWAAFHFHTHPAETGLIL